MYVAKSRMLISEPNAYPSVTLPKARFYKMSRAIFVWRTFTSAIQRALASGCFVV